MNAFECYVDAIKNYVNFKGRATRPQYWWFFLINFILGNVLTYAVSEQLGSIYNLALLLPSLAVGVRRLHDGGNSGWMLIIPIYNIILLASEGDQGANEYGPNPSNPSEANVYNEDLID